MLTMVNIRCSAEKSSLWEAPTDHQSNIDGFLTSCLVRACP